MSVVAMSSVLVEVLEGLYQHRLLSTTQIREIHAPSGSLRWVQQKLARLQEQGLVESVVALPGRLKVWFLTEPGAEVVEAVASRTEPRRKLLTRDLAAGQLQPHTLAVNDVGIAYLRAARVRGDEFGALSWRHEIAHPITAPSRGSKGEAVIADAVLSYLLLTDRRAVSVQQRFIELDRGTMPVEQLVVKLERYARLAHQPTATAAGEGGSGWRASYRTFPRVQIVLTGRPRHRLERRMRLLLALAHATPGLRADQMLSAQVTYLEDLQRHGPFAGIWRPIADPTQPVDWLGTPTTTDPERRRAS